MLRRFSRQIAIALCLWFPLQVLAAVTMPFCRTGGEGMDVVAAQADHSTHGGQHEHCAGAASASGSGGDADHTPLQGCDQCLLCHLACASVLPVAPIAWKVGPGQSAVITESQDPPSYFPEHPLRPPRSPAA
jgi:hypothetical protein